MIFGRFRKKKEDDIPLPASMEAGPDLPEDLERFRVKTPEIRPPATDYPVPEVPPYGKSVEELVSERTSGDKIELILQKLETIDARLRLIEEKIKRY
jgi:hypothetical protein